MSIFNKSGKLIITAAASQAKIITKLFRIAVIKFLKADTRAKLEIC